MKKLISVELPEDFNHETDYFRIEIRRAPGGDIFADDVDFDEVTLPTEEEIEEIQRVRKQVGKRAQTGINQNLGYETPRR